MPASIPILQQRHKTSFCLMPSCVKAPNLPAAWVIITCWSVVSIHVYPGLERTFSVQPDEHYVYCLHLLSTKSDSEVAKD